MRKFATVAMAMALGTVSSVALADGNAFVNTNLGASHYQVDNPFTGYDNSFSKTGKAGALRAGYRWNSVVDYGVEAGYGYLGNATARAAFPDGSIDRQQVKTRGWLLGANLNYNIAEHWYVGGRLGWFRARTSYEERYTNVSGQPSNYRGWEVATGEYFGVGGGYNVNKSFSLGLAYDTYRAPNADNSYSTRIGMYSLQAEYRF
ncbi:MAG TPA: outer membrane beta-barrel protein [Dyella sp.]|uniref:outer membrane beta-barrel protein n=1 Tax=Dyella sp. TaxID=1869338 RepID=UPI002CAC24D6|nr:outer membrane beta-barrel protein [Dyella sp.]HTV86753.1 outer membrane beta-barrel protein [Dyella sp.]